MDTGFNCKSPKPISSNLFIIHLNKVLILQQSILKDV